MKKLLLFFIFSGSLDCFCQTTGTMRSLIIGPDTLIQGSDGTFSIKRYEVKSDTIRATLIVYYDSGLAILHTKPGYVVRKLGEEEVYLDDKKRVVKSPLEVFSYKLKK